MENKTDSLKKCVKCHGEFSEWMGIYGPYCTKCAVGMRNIACCTDDVKQPTLGEIAYNTAGMAGVCGPFEKAGNHMKEVFENVGNAVADRVRNQTCQLKPMFESGQTVFLIDDNTMMRRKIIEVCNRCVHHPDGVYYVLIGENRYFKETELFAYEQAHAWVLGKAKQL